VLGVVGFVGVVSEAGIEEDSKASSCPILLIFSRLIPAFFAVSTTSDLICSVSVFIVSTVF